MKRALAPLLLVLLWLGAVTSWIAAGPAQDSSDTADVAVVLGAAVVDDQPSPVFAARIDHAIALYKAGRVRGLIFTGGRAPEDNLSEAAAARDYAVGKGVAARDIVIEEQSRTTWQNLHEARRLMQGAGTNSALIVSDPLHLRRASLMARELGIVAKVSATPTSRYKSWSSKAPFLARELFFVHYFWVTGQ